MGRRLIVNADDFGWTRDVNRGILQARLEGVLRSTTLMANGAAFEDAARLANEHPELDVGVHLTLVGGQALARASGEQLPGGLAQLIFGLSGRWSAAAIQEEFSAQIEKVQSAGIRPTHLDTHKHTHLLPPVLKALIAVGKRYSIPWVRRPFDLLSQEAQAGASAGRRFTSRIMRARAAALTRCLAAAGLRATDHFAGFQMTGSYDAADLASLIESLPDGTTEFMCHPGVCGQDLSASNTRLKQSREAELRALTSDEALAAVRRAGVELSGFGDLS